MKCGISNGLALATNYDTELVSGLFVMRDSGGFPAFPFRLSFFTLFRDCYLSIIIRFISFLPSKI